MASSSKADKAEGYDDIMTVKMVAKYLHLSTTKIYELAQKNIIPCNKAAGKGKWLFSKQLILEWVIDESLKYRSEEEEGEEEQK